MLIEHRCPVKTMKLELVEGERLVPLLNSSPVHSSMKIFNLVFEAEAFLYKLIRRITGALVHLAKGQMTPADIEGRFLSPADYYESQLPQTLKPQGLFLVEVKYKEEDFLNPPVQRLGDTTVDMDIDEIQYDCCDQSSDSENIRAIVQR